MFDLMLATATSTRANLYPAITLDVFPGFRYGALYGVLNIGHGLGGTLGVIVGGLVFDMSGSYFSSLLIVIALAIIAGVLLRSVYKPSNRIITQTDPLI